MPEFSDDRFSANIPQWRAVFAGLGWRADEPKTAVEIGSYEGRSALWTLETLLRHPDSVLHCIDTFEDEAGRGEAPTASLLERFSRNVHTTSHAAKVRVHAAHSIDALIVLASQGLNADFVYIGGSRQAPDVLADLVLAFKVLRPGGVLICDEAPGSSEPRNAIDAFTSIYRDKLALAGPRSPQFACIKTAE